MSEEQTPEEISPESGLNMKQERFCLEYLKDLNAFAAAKRAGYTEKGAQHSGLRILAMPEAKAFIKTEQDKINAKLKAAAEVVNNELLNITFLERGEFLDPDGDLKNLNELPEHLRAAVQVQTKKIKSEGKLTTVTTYSLFNKIQMMEKISKRLERQKTTPEIQNGPSNTALMEDGTIEEI